METQAKTGPLIRAGHVAAGSQDLHQMFGGCGYKGEPLVNGAGFGVLERQDKFRFAAEKENERPWFPGDCPSRALFELG